MGQVTRDSISLSRFKLIKSLVISILFVLIGLWMILFQPETGNPIFNAPLIKYGAAIVCIFFFSWAALALARKLGQKESGILIDENGITDRSSANSVGLIEWKDITGFSSAKMMRQKFILVQVTNPKNYIEKASSAVLKKSLEYNAGTFGTPIAISANALACKLPELEARLKKGLAEFRA